MKRKLFGFMVLITTITINAQSNLVQDTIYSWQREIARYQRSKEYDACIAYCDSFVKYRYNECEYLNSKARYLAFGKDKYDQANSVLANSLMIGCDSVDVYVAYSRIQSTLKNHKLALSYIDKAIELKPDSAELYMEKSNICVTIRDYQNGIDALRKARDLGSKDAKHMLDQLEKAGIKI